MRDTPVRIKGRGPEKPRNSSTVSIKYIYIYVVMFDGKVYHRHFNLTPYMNAGFYNKIDKIDVL